MKWKKQIGICGLIFMFLILSACGRQEPAEPTASPEAAETADETSTSQYTLSYRVRTVTLSEGNETFLFQQEDEKGFLSLLNRQTGEEIPPDIAEDPDFVNDGRYEIYDTSVCHVSETGERSLPEQYEPVPAPPYPGGVFSYISEAGPVALRFAADGTVLSLERAYERWIEPPPDQSFGTQDRWYIRVLERDGTEKSCKEIEPLNLEGGANADTFTVLNGDLLVVAREKTLLFFGTDGKERFTVTTPMPVRELCLCRDGRLAVLLREDHQTWLSLIEPESRSVGVPQRMPEDSHTFCAGPDGDSLYFIRNTEVFSLNLTDWTIMKEISLLELGIRSTEVSAMYSREEGSIHFLLHEWHPETETFREVYCVARPTRVNREGIALRLGFENISGTLQSAITDFNRTQSAIRIETVDYRNRRENLILSETPDIFVMDEGLYEELLSAGKLAGLNEFLAEDPDRDETEIFPGILKAFSDQKNVVRRIAANFWIESMACDFNAVSGRSILTESELREVLGAMPAGSRLYEPWYTAERLREDLRAVNGNELSATLQNFAALLPEKYDYSSYTADTASVEKRIYDGRLLMMQAHVGTLEEFKWYDAFFPSEAVFPGWPTETGSASRLCFDECLGISAGCGEEQKKAAWQFIRQLLGDEYERKGYGFPVRIETMKKIMTEDAAAVSYRIDEDGKFELNKKGEKIEIARSSWYSPEWRQHYVYALTEKQQEKLLQLIDSAV